MPFTDMYHQQKKIEIIFTYYIGTTFCVYPWNISQWYVILPGVGGLERTSMDEYLWVGGKKYMEMN